MHWTSYSGNSKRLCHETDARQIRCLFRDKYSMLNKP